MVSGTDDFYYFWLFLFNCEWHDCESSIVAFVVAVGPLSLVDVAVGGALSLHIRTPISIYIAPYNAIFICILPLIPRAFIEYDNILFDYIYKCTPFKSIQMINKKMTREKKQIMPVIDVIASQLLVAAPLSAMCDVSFIVFIQSVSFFPHKCAADNNE